jgi:hypothetical protein
VAIELQERRMSNHLTGLIDDALALANKCGWRYALAYLISEGVSAETIQRLLKGGARAQAAPFERPAPQRPWKGRHPEEMTMLFASLSHR